MENHFDEKLSSLQKSQNCDEVVDFDQSDDQDYGNDFFDQAYTKKRSLSSGNSFRENEQNLFDHQD